MTATLTFGCGSRDETFRTLGVTHLIEHLAMGTLGRVHYEHNAMVGLETTQFYATGRPEQIVAFLATICQALGDLPLGRIEKEAGVLAAEGSQVVHPTAAALLTRRFGTVGYGLAPWVGPGYDRIWPEMVQAHAAKYFTRGNAVLTMTGPPPEGLRVELPTGERPVRAEFTPLRVDGPRWSPEAVPCAGLALLGPATTAAWTIGMRVLDDRLTSIARREKGLSYHIDGEQAEIDPARTDRLIWLDARDGQENEVAAILWNTARDLAGTGPEPEEIAHEVAAFKEAVTDPRYIEADLDWAAEAELFGIQYRTPADWLAELSAVTPEDVTARFAESLRTALMVVPEDCRVELSDLDGGPVAEGGCTRGTVVPAGQVFRPPLRARATDPAARRARLVLTPTSVVLRDADGDVHEVAFGQVVGVQIDDDARTVFGANGCLIPVDPGLFKGAATAVHAIDTKIDPALRFQRTGLISEN
jgi:predicted Zn-dependent peptidase